MMNTCHYVRVLVNSELVGQLRDVIPIEPTSVPKVESQSMDGRHRLGLCTVSGRDFRQLKDRETYWATAGFEALLAQPSDCCTVETILLCMLCG